MVKFFKSLYWKTYIFILALKWIPQVNLGDTVIYKGKEYHVSNGVRIGCWKLSGLDNGDEGWVERVNCKKVYTLKNCYRSFLSGYRFYRWNWYRIWMRTGIKDWMRGCKIWPIKKVEIAPEANKEKTS